MASRFAVMMGKMAPVNTEDMHMMARERWVEQSLKALPAGYRVLDAGAGQRHKAQYCQHLDYVSQDFAVYDDSDGEHDIVCDITAIPEKDGSFDAVLCVEVFEHIPDPIRALAELARVLKPGGTMLITAPFATFSHFEPHFYHTGFSGYWYQTHFPAVGLDIQELSTVGNFHAYLDQELERIPDMARIHCGVKRLSRWDRLGLRLTRSLLKRLMEWDKSSQDFACFGFCVRAQKRMKLGTATPPKAGSRQAAQKPALRSGPKSGQARKA